MLFTWRLTANWEGGIANVVQVSGKGVCLEADSSQVFRAFLETQADNHLFVGPQVGFHHLTVDESALPQAMQRVYFYEAARCEAQCANQDGVVCKSHYLLFVGYLLPFLTSTWINYFYYIVSQKTKARKSQG